jgi:D-alanyl-D-alanine carboxypeptidase (penicillin-binding protein 5/6)
MCRSLRRAGFTVVLSGLILVLMPLYAAANQLDEPSVAASSALVVDAMTGEVLYALDAESPRAMASLTKLFTAFVALETTPLNRRMTVAPADLVGEASMGLEAGESMTFETLLHGMLLPSGNDAASTIARELGEGSQDRFMQRANQRLREIGLQHTNLVNPHGLDADGHYSSAHDIAALVLYALHHEPQFAATLATQSYSGDGHTVFSTNRFFGVYPGFVGGKTGVTDDAGYCLMQIAERDGRVVVAVLLGSTSVDWYDDAAALLDYGFATLAVPGRSMGSEVITPVDGTQQSALAIDRSGFAITEFANGAIVTAPAVDLSRTWSPWFWFAATGVLVPALLVLVVQCERFLTLLAYGAPRRTPRMTGRSVVPVVQLGPRASAWETRSLDAGGGTYRSPAVLTPSASGFARTSSPDQATRRGAPVTAPAWGGD